MPRQGSLQTLNVFNFKAFSLCHCEGCNNFIFYLYNYTKTLARSYNQCLEILFSLPTLFVFISAQQRLELDHTFVDCRPVARCGSSPRLGWCRRWPRTRIQQRLLTLGWRLSGSLRVLLAVAVEGGEVEHVGQSGLLHYGWQLAGLFPRRELDARSRKKVPHPRNQRPGNIPGACNHLMIKGHRLMVPN